LIVLDTNVISELMRSRVAPAVEAWVNHFCLADLFISAVTRAEVERGVNLVPRGANRNTYRTLADRTFALFKGRCLPFEETAAIYFGKVQARRQRAGRPISTEDAQIASIALSHGMKVATRNTRDFQGIDGLEVVNPFVEKISD
jgi:predicted nucleic acid-binding protein